MPMRRGVRLPAAIVIVVGSALAGMFVTWSAPGIERYTRDWLTRIRGTLPAPDDIAIVAVDDASISRFGQFPWPRSVMARLVDAVSAAHPKVIAIDVLYPDPSEASQDDALASAFARAGNVVLAAELVDHSSSGMRAEWLLPIPALRSQAAAIGHINVGIESDGIARQILLEQTDDQGHPVRAMPLEAFRVANHVPSQAVTDTGAALVVGPLTIPAGPGPEIGIESRGTQPVVRPAGRMEIDYIGPSGSFSAHTYGAAEVLDAHLPPGTLHDKFILVGATAASLGERFASPFVHYSDAHGNQHGSPMTGVEVLANALNTILRQRFYSDTPGPVAFLACAAAAGLMLFLLSIASGRYELLRHLLAIAAGFVAVTGTCYLVYRHLLVFPPLAPALVSFASAGVLGLVHRSIRTSRELDEGIRQAASSGALFPSGDSNTATAAESITRITGVLAAAVLRLTGPKQYQVISSYGLPVSRSSEPERVFRIDDPAIALLRHDVVGGILLLVRPAGIYPAPRSIRLAQAIAADAVAEAADGDVRFASAALPRTLEWKAARVAQLNQRFALRAGFFRSAMQAVEDGLLIAGLDGRILFGNAKAAAFLGSTEEALPGTSISKLIGDPGAENEPELLARLVLDRTPLEREIGLGTQRFILRIAPVIGPGSTPAGIVASLSDITRQHELAQTKNDVVTLVSHELRTPLTAIQGMTELLANYEIEPARRKELTTAINDEVKRLARMITDYLDITRLEMGKTEVRRIPVRLDALIERTALLFGPVAQQRQISLEVSLPAGLPPILGDPDLLLRLLTNLVSNAIKYSPAQTTIRLTGVRTGDQVTITVEDQGYGIPEPDIDRIFEKFYRVPRVQDADVPGTGLGLSFVRDIVDLHNGTLLVQSEVGKGSVFTVTFPCREGV